MIIMSVSFIQSPVAATTTSIGVFDLEVSALVNGGEDDGNSIASLLLAMTVLNVVCSMAQAQTSVCPTAEAFMR